MSKKEELNVKEVVANLKVPNPPKRYCGECGAELSWEYEKARYPNSNRFVASTGKERILVETEYYCPKSKKHDLGEATFTAIYDTGDGNWYWRHLFSLEFIYPQ